MTDKQSLQSLENDPAVRAIEGSAGEFNVFLKRDSCFEDRVRLARNHLGEPQTVRKDAYNCYLEFDRGRETTKIWIYYFPYHWGRRLSKPKVMKMRNRGLA